MEISQDQLTELEQAARDAARFSYSPFSGFAVGAAVLTGTGKIVSGCNIENASFGLTICAERAAIFHAVSGGCREIAALAIYSPTHEATPPCGACRQVLHEFGPEARIVCICDSDQRLETTLESLLPAPFGPTATEGSLTERERKP
jgi:cytidine deaminase